MDKTKSTIFRVSLQIALLLFLYFICRVAFIWANKNEFDFSSYSVLSLCIYGIRFDLSAIFTINLLFIVLSLLPAPFILNRYYHAFLKWLFIISNGFFILLNLVDVAYFPFVHKRMQFDAFQFVNGKKGYEFYDLLPEFLFEYWYLVLLYILCIVFLYKAYNRTLLIQQKVQQSLKSYLYASATFVVGIGLSIIAFRGGLQLQPLSIIQASEMTNVQNIPVILNAPFSVTRTFEQKILKDLKYFPDDQLTGCFSGIHNPATTKPFQKENVVIIIVESLSRKYMSFFNGEGKTPFLDSLFSQSLVFTNGFANAKESIQGIPAILSSIPSWQDESFISSPYSTNKITSVANLLKKEGYTSSFFHGGNNGTMGFNAYCKLAGFDNYYGRTEYNNEDDFDGDWGIWDEPFLQFTADKLSETKQPFVSSIFTLNLHNPFRIPEKYKDRFNQKGHIILPTIQYTDYALQRFFEKIKNTEWFGNTLFIITADHTGKKTGILNTVPLDDYRIPIVFYKADGSVKGINNTIANQIDIMPSIMHLLNYPHPYFSFGNNLFSNQCNHFSINYKENVYEYIDSTYCYQFNGEKGIGFYNWRTDSTFSKNLYNKSLNDLKRSEADLKKKIQLFNVSMGNNKMCLLSK